MNIERLEILRDAIGVSDTYDQSRYYNTCGTPACIAGHAQYLFPEQGGEAALGLTEVQQAMLFAANPWPFVDRSPTREHAAAVIHHLIDTGEVDWKIARDLVR